MNRAHRTSRGSALAGRHVSVEVPLQTLPATRRSPRSSRAGIVALAVGIVGLLGLSFGVGGTVQQQRARAQVATYETFSITATLNRYLDEIDQITTDQIRKIVVKQITKKVIEKIIYGQNGGTGIGGALGTAGGGQGAFINDYYQYLYLSPQSRTSEYIDKAFDKIFPSGTDPQVKQAVKAAFDPNQQLVPSNCVDVRSIDFNTDKEASIKLMYALQPGCNNMSATAMLYDLGRDKLLELSQAAQTEATANKGLVSKKKDKLQQSGVVYEGIIQGALEAVYNVQTESESAVSQIIGALVDQVIDELLSQTTE